MRIGQLARSIGVNIETIRYYQRIGLIDLPAKPYAGYRSYNEHDLQRLRFIRGAQRRASEGCPIIETFAGQSERH